MEVAMDKPDSTSEEAGDDIVILDDDDDNQEKGKTAFVSSNLGKLGYVVLFYREHGVRLEVCGFIRENCNPS